LEEKSRGCTSGVNCQLPPSYCHTSSGTDWNENETAWRQISLLSIQWLFGRREQ
jgi:hypothetical protein